MVPHTKAAGCPHRGPSFPDWPGRRDDQGEVEPGEEPPFFCKAFWLKAVSHALVYEPINFTDKPQ